MNRSSLTALSSLCALSACLLLPLGARAGAAADPAMAMDGVLVDAAQMTLYTFDQDAVGSGKSSCNGPCAANWPPLLAPAGASAQGHWTLVMREDGAAQWAYMGHPLYRWAKDQKPGDRTGDGVKGVWHLAKP